MHLDQTSPLSLALFCKVVDNYGDVGICWRLARQLQKEHGIAVSLWIDDLPSFQRLCPAVLPDADCQVVEGVCVRHWRNQGGEFGVSDVADIVIEFFACDIPPAYITAMAACDPRPVWLNLEGLSAEEWVEGCHTLPSPHPRLSLIKHFFFPGFTKKTGGLLCEQTLARDCAQFQAEPSIAATFLAQYGVTPAEMASLKVSLFCYPHAPVAALFDAWQCNASPITCLVPEGVAVETVAAFLGQRPVVGAAHTRGALTVRVLPFVAQPDYDKLLWACDVNFVRGEDSFVRAQWAGQPFIWHIYPQDENLHHKKLSAFLQRYATGIDGLTAFSSAWNGDHAAVNGECANWPALCAQLRNDIPKIAHRAASWQHEMRENGDMASNLLKFAASLRQLPVKK